MAHIIGQIRQLIIDAGMTLLFPARPIGETYAAHSVKFGVKADPNLLDNAFYVSYKKNTSLFFEKYGGKTSAALEKSLWFDIFSDAFRGGGYEVPPFACFEEVSDAFAEADAWKPNRPVVAALKKLRDCGVQASVASNWDDRLHRVLDGWQLTSMFTQVFLSADVGYRKPAEAFYPAIFNALGCLPEEVLFCGDDPIGDIAVPKKVGCQTCDPEGLVQIAETFVPLQK